MLIIIGNVSVEILVQKGSALTRPVNEQNVMKDCIKGISWIQFINLGLVLFMINISIKLGKDVGDLPAGILQGKYDDISSMWYMDVGTQILLAMILEIGAPHSVPILMFVIHSIRRCWDRSGSCDRRRSKKLL